VLSRRSGSNTGAATSGNRSYSCNRRGYRMSEMRLEPSEPTLPPSRRPPPAPDPSEGSLAAGVGLAWAIVVGSHFALAIVAAFVGAGLPHAITPIVIWPLAFLPELTAVLVAIWLIQRGRKRTGIG